MARTAIPEEIMSQLSRNKVHQAHTVYPKLFPSLKAGIDSGNHKQTGEGQHDGAGEKEVVRRHHGLAQKRHFRSAQNSTWLLHSI